MSTVIASLPEAGPHQVLARLFFINALGFRDAAAGLILLRRQMGSPPHPYVFFENLAYAYEHSFKGLLAFAGWTAERLRKDIGHDLLAGYAEAVAAGYVPPPALKAELDILGPLHDAPYELRYLQDKSVDLPDPMEKSLKVAFDAMDAMRNQMPIDALGEWE